MRGALTLATVLILTSSAALPSTPARTAGTELRGLLLDPVTGAGIAGATVRMGPAQGVTTEDGYFDLRIPKRRKKPYATSVLAAGYETYSTWTLPGTSESRDLYLFPTHAVSVADSPDPVPAAEFSNQFNIIYRTRLLTPVSSAGEVLHRWTSQPEFVVGSHVFDSVTIDGVDYWRATNNRLDSRELDLLRTLLRTYVPLLTGGQFHGDDVRVRKMRPGDLIRTDYYSFAPPGQLGIYAHISRSATGGLAIVDGSTIVSGGAFLHDSLLRLSADSSYARTIVHELAHALGMEHPANAATPTVPYCSIMGFYVCLGDRHVSDLDIALARLAYSRLPGNDRQDRDPRPLPAGGTQPPAVLRYEGARSRPWRRCSHTAARMIAPFSTSCRLASTLFRPRMLLITPMMRIPTSVPPTVPVPPRRAVPPTTTAAIASSS